MHDGVKERKHMLMNRERESRKRPRRCWDIDPAITRAITGS